MLLSKEHSLSARPATPCFALRVGYHNRTLTIDSFLLGLTSHLWFFTFWILFHHFWSIPCFISFCNKCLLDVTLLKNVTHLLISKEKSFVLRKEKVWHWKRKDNVDNFDMINLHRLSIKWRILLKYQGIKKLISLKAPRTGQIKKNAFLSVTFAICQTLKIKTLSVFPFSFFKLKQCTMKIK